MKFGFRKSLTVIDEHHNCKYIRLGDGVAIFRRWHGKKNCTGRILVKLPKPWIQGSQGSHKFNLDEVNLTMKPNVIEKVSCQCTAKVRQDRPRGRPKKKKPGLKNSPKPSLGQAEIQLPVLEPDE